MMRGIIDGVGGDVLTGVVPSTQWEAAQSKNYYSISVLWGVIGPQKFFGNGSEYSWLYYGFLLGPLAVLATYAVHRWKPQWRMEYIINPPLIFYGITYFPRYNMTNFLTSFLVGIFLRVVDSTLTCPV
jgi:hypothetical protein